VVAVAVVAAGALAEGGVGVATPPFLFPWWPAVDPAALAVAAGCFAAAIAFAPRLLAARPLTFAAGGFATGLGLRLACAAARDGAGAWSQVFDPARSGEARNEYLPALGALRHGAALFLDRFAEVVPALPVHAAGHPPGLLLTIDALALDTPARLAALCLAGGALVVPLTYAAARHVVDDARARVAALLVAFSPAMLLFGATSPDALYATLGVAAAWGLVARRAAGAAMLAIASFFAWSLLAVGAWATVLIARRDGLRAAARTAAACALAPIAFYLALAAATGYDHLGALAATEQVYRNSIARFRPYWYWVLGSPVAFAAVLGVPVAAYALRARGPAAVAIAAVVAVSAIAGFTKAETERIWLFLVPFACLAAATTLPRGRLAPVLAALAVQALAIELHFDTIW
jgi:methylthioxylose transferase